MRISDWSSDVCSSDLFRPLTAALAVMGGDYQLSGVPRMHERPIGDLVDALLVLGADIRYLGNPNYPPLAIGRGDIRSDKPIGVKGSVSSQFLTALLMARSEEHTSELQSLMRISYAVFCLKKKKKKQITN